MIPLLHPGTPHQNPPTWVYPSPNPLPQQFEVDCQVVDVWELAERGHGVWRVRLELVEGIGLEAEAGLEVVEGERIPVVVPIHSG